MLPHKSASDVALRGEKGSRPTSQREMLHFEAGRDAVGVRRNRCRWRSLERMLLSFARTDAVDSGKESRGKGRAIQ